jgi:glycosyltransferase involved in cell wall biosynthesis
MVEAVALLVSRGEDVTLDLIGWATAKDPILEEVETLALAKGINERVKYHGSRPLGPELFAFYIRSDIFVTASMASEGFPRTILEAMAHSLPVVATRVGSIAAYIEGAAELVPPRDVGALADAIFRLIHQPELRRQLIQRGFELAHSNTLEVQTGKMVSIIQEWIRKK